MKAPPTRYSCVCTGSDKASKPTASMLGTTYEQHFVHGWTTPDTRQYGPISATKWQLPALGVSVGQETQPPELHGVQGSSFVQKTPSPCWQSRSDPIGFPPLPLAMQSKDTKVPAWWASQ